MKMIAAKRKRRAKRTARRTKATVKKVRRMQMRRRERVERVEMKARVTDRTKRMRVQGGEAKSQVSTLRMTSRMKRRHKILDF